MFFTGTLQEGIGSAVQQKKRVVCFVHDDSSESSRWETQYLTPLAAPLDDHAVVLKIRTGSQEAAFLSAICPVADAPMVVVISNGQVKQALKPPIEVAEFRKQILAAMDLSFTISDPKNSSSATPASSKGKGVAKESLSGSASGSNVSSSGDGPAAPVDPKEEQLARVRREAHQRHQKQKDERQRVLDNIRADKEERRKAAEARARERAREQGLPDNDENESESGKARQRPESTVTRLQLRLDDGRSVRSEFPATDPLRSVREWLIADNTTVPRRAKFTFRPVIGVGAAPAISSEDESKSLRELGLVPSATLIVKISGGGAASTHAAGNGFFARIWALLMALLMPIWHFVAAPSVAGTATGAQTNNAPLDDNLRSRRTMQHDAIGRSTALPPGSAGAGADSSSEDATSRKRDNKPAFYNGNQTSVLPTDPPSDHERD